MNTTARVFSSSSIGFLIALMIGCIWINNDLYEESHDCHRKGRRALAQGDYLKAQENLNRALKIWPSQLSDGSDMAAVHNNLGRAFAAQSKHEEAVKNFKKGRNMFRKDTSCSHPFLAVLLNNFCDSRISQKKWTDAQDTCLAAFIANTNRLPEKGLPDLPPEDPAWGLFNWGVAGAQVNNAKFYYRPISQVLEQEQPALNPVEISDVYFQLGRLSLQRGDYQDSEQFHQRAFSIRDEKFGTTHEITADSIAALGQAKLCQGRFLDAETDERQALSVRQKLLESGHPDLAKSYVGIGLVLEAQEKQQEALNSYWQAFQASVRSLAVSTSESLKQAFRRYAKDTNPDSPEQAFIALKKCRSSIETQTRLTAMSLHGIGRVLSKDNPNASDEHFDALALSVREATLGENHPLTVQSHLAMGRAFEARLNLAEAEIHNRRALEIAETSLGSNHRVTGVAFYDLARIMRLQNQTEEADRFLNNAQSILKEGLKPGDIVNDQYVSDLRGRIERDYWIDELQGPEDRTSIAWDAPRLPRDHQLLSEFIEKKRSEFITMIQPGQKPDDVIKRFINMIDDPFDDFKHEVHGMRLFGYRVFWWEGFMKGAGDPCK